MTRKILIQGILSELAIPVVVVATYALASHNASVDVGAVDGPAEPTATASASPEVTVEPSPETGGGGTVVVTPPVVHTSAPQPQITALPTTPAVVSPVTHEPVVSHPRHEPTTNPTTRSPAPVATLPIEAKYGAAHLVYTYQGAQGPRPTSCAAWAPSIVLTDLNGTARKASVLTWRLTFPNNPPPSQQLITRFVCDWDFVGYVPRGLDYAVKTTVPSRTDVLVKMASIDPVVFTGATTDPDYTTGVLLYLTT